jgi:hypothetical protein
VSIAACCFRDAAPAGSVTRAAHVGLLIEITFIATFTQRFFNAR